MEPSDFETIRPHLERAIDDIDYFLDADNERENAREEAGKLYDLMEADNISPEVKGQGKPVELTPERYAALEWRTVSGEPITDEQREAILASVLPGLPISDEGCAALQFALRGGWRESSRQAAVWLRNAGETVAADGIEVALSRLFGEPRDATELLGYREAMRMAAEYVLTILVQYPIQRADGLLGRLLPDPPPHQQLLKWAEVTLANSKEGELVVLIVAQGVTDKSKLREALKYGDSETRAFNTLLGMLNKKLKQGKKSRKIDAFYWIDGAAPKDVKLLTSDDAKVRHAR